MKKQLTLVVLLAISEVVCPVARAEHETATLRCYTAAALLAAPGGTAERKYAPDRELQIRHLALDVTPDFKSRTIQGKAALRFKAVVRPAREIRLDAVGLRIQDVTATEKVQSWQNTDVQLIVTFSEAIPAEKECTLTVVYSAEPERGLYFRTPEMGYPEGDAHLFTQGESIEARHWYPCLDTPNQQFTSEIICRVPDGMTAVSNGRLLSTARDPVSGLKAIHWLQDKRHANYLISLVAGYLKKIEDKYKDVPLAFHTPPSLIDYAATSFRDTKAMLKYFEEEIGVPYPWDKYDQVCVNDFVAGGMENTSLTILTDGTLFTPATENIRDSEGLVAHELVHQWFGDLVTCKDWSHLWLNEGFATYYESLWNGFHNGRDSMLYELYQRARDITAIQNDHTPIVRRTYDRPEEMFGYLVYPKAGWVLHMLRCQLGDELFRLCVKTYLQKHQFGNVVTEDFRGVVEQLSGRSFDQFFDQWLYHGHHPELEVAYSWDEPSRLARVSIQQVQVVNADVLLFNFPLTIRFKGKFGTLDRDILVSRKQEDFYFPLESAPEGVRLDPDYTLLAKVKFSVPNSMLHGQLADGNDVLGRLLAVEQLRGRQDHESIRRLKTALNEDSFFGVRIEASRALRACRTDEALDALIASAKQADARVRRQVVDDVGGFYHAKARDFARDVLGEEKNPDVLMAALHDLAGYAGAEVTGVLLKSLHTESFRNEIADTAIAAMRSQDDPAFISPLLETLSNQKEAFTSHGFAQGLGALAYLARNEEKKDAVREFLVSHLDSKRLTIQLSAISALGALGDPRAIAVVQKFATAANDSPTRSTAERALTSLRAARKPVDDFKNLRQEVLDLQKADREMKRELDDLKKKVEASRNAGGIPPSPPQPKPRTKSPKEM